MAQASSTILTGWGCCWALPRLALAGAVDEAAIPSPPPAFTPGPANGPVGVNRSPEPVTQLEQEDLDPQMRDGVPAWAALDTVKLGDGCPGT